MPQASSTRPYPYPSTGQPQGVDPPDGAQDRDRERDRDTTRDGDRDRDRDRDTDKDRDRACSNPNWTCPKAWKLPIPKWTLWPCQIATVFQIL